MCFLFIVGVVRMIDYMFGAAGMRLRFNETKNDE